MDTLLTIPITPFSKCVLTTTYGSGIVAIPDYDVLHVLLLSTYPRIDKDFRLPLLSDNITFAVKYHPKFHHKDTAYIGHALYEHHTHMMCHYVHAKADTGIKITEAIQEWLSHHNITDDIYSTPTAYKRYQRYMTYYQSCHKPREIKHVQHTIVHQPDNLDKIINTHTANILHTMHQAGEAFTTPHAPQHILEASIRHFLYDQRPKFIATAMDQPISYINTLINALDDRKQTPTFIRIVIQGMLREKNNY